MTDHVTTHQAADDARNEDILIYLNGQLLPKERALVSVYDSGLCLGTVFGRGCAFIMAHGPLWMNI